MKLFSKFQGPKQEMKGFSHFYKIVAFVGKAICKHARTETHTHMRPCAYAHTLLSTAFQLNNYDQLSEPCSMCPIQYLSKLVLSSQLRGHCKLTYEGKWLLNASQSTNKTKPLGSQNIDL